MRIGDMKVAQRLARRTGWTVAIAVVLAAGAGALGAPPAMAGLQHEYAVFSQCPFGPGVVACIYSETTAGEFKLGNKPVPISKPVILQGGIKAGSTQLVPAANGETLSHTSLPVPGGIIGIELLGPLTSVNATAELVGPVQVDVEALASGNGSAVTLPIRAHLENPLLGGQCYVGSERVPVTPHLTSGTTSPPPPATPLTGSAGTLELVGAGKIDVLRGSRLVDNTFPVPGVSGCGGLLSLLIDPVTDGIIGVPAGAGHNDAILEGTLDEASAGIVQHELELPQIGRCVKAPTERVEGRTVFTGLYEDAGCTYESPQREGKFEWVPGIAGASSLTGSGGTATLQTTGEATIVCTGSSESGSYTGLKSATLAATFTGCARKLTKTPCQSAGAASGQIHAEGIQAQLGFVKDLASEVSVGFDLRPASAVTASCGGEAVKVTGSVIAPVPTADHMETAYTLPLKGKAGVQAVTGFEEQPPDTLSASFGGGGGEAASLNTSLRIANPEKLEIKAKVE